MSADLPAERRDALSLDGTWTLIGPGGERVETTVPGCWDTAFPKDEPGPFRYERTVDVPAAMAGRRLWLRFEGVSYHARVLLDGVEVGEHTGAWDDFAFDVTDRLAPGRASTLAVEVEKPASLREGPASEPVPGRFGLKETLAGFLPYVWGHLFGGVWQSVWLEARADVGVEDLFVRARADGRFTAEVRLDGAAPFALEVVAPGGEVVARAAGQGPEATVEGRVDGARPWSPAEPSLYRLRLSVDGEALRTVPFGFRTFEARGAALVLNGAPVYLRMALSWGWYPGALHANPGPERARADLLRLRELGYNGVKLCLWVPPDYVFDLADELGMLLWLELPMWLPKATPFFRRQTPREYGRIVRRVRRHPSLVLMSLGCELDREVGAEILEPLYHQTKGLAPDVLLRDNSGSGEAYGGLLDEYADTYDYHFYSDLQHFGTLLDTFTPRWRPVQPWVFGEFCDLDTFRDPRRLEGADGAAPWWTSADPDVNPQGARWQYDAPFQLERLRENGFLERGEELERVSEAQALHYRKAVLERVRTYREISGYVVTGERDTPISTAGMWDDADRLKFASAAFRAFNDDLTLSLGWDKRRAWVRGGDRVAYWDTFSYPGGATVRAHLVAAHHASGGDRGRVRWRAAVGGDEVGAGAAEAAVDPGDVREVAIAAFALPDVERPVRVDLEAELDLGGARTRNAWALWCFPKGAWADVAPFALVDPAGRLRGLETLTEVTDGPPNAGGAQAVVVATAWSAALDGFVRAGGRAVLLLSGDEGEPLTTVPTPFWREAVKVLEPHPAWGDFPHDGFTDLQFYGMAPDLALDTAGETGARPVLRRLDARTMALHDYAVELPLGAGRLLATTLRFGGGLGDQPSGVTRNTAAAYLLSRFVHELQAGGRPGAG